ncbi:MAG: hypothetical protein IKT53_04080 [Bacteroidaceae bacterium]|nr:hypothetical protein [Bacteroidaceae bacterium]
MDSAIAEYENDTQTKEKTFLGNLAKVLGAKKHGSNSQYATFEAVKKAGVEVVEATPEMVQAVLGAEMMSVNDRLSQLEKVSKIVANWLKNNVRGRSIKVELPLATQRKIRAKMGRNFGSHVITANNVAHSKKNHGENGIKNTENSIPLRDEDFALMPYIMVSPSYVERGSFDSKGSESVRFYKILSNGYVVVVEKEQKNSPNDMETITMWAELSANVPNARNMRPSKSTSETVTISPDDAAKIRKDAENAIRADVKVEKSTAAAPFYSNAKKAVLDIKQEKATPQQWVAMLKKNGGLKVGEDAWVGLEEWLNKQDGSVTKQEILDYINENSIRIEEVESEDLGKIIDYGLEAVEGDLERAKRDLKYEEAKISIAEKRLQDSQEEYDKFISTGEELKRKYGENSPEYRNHIFYDSYTDALAGAKRALENAKSDVEYRRNQIAELENAVAEKKVQKAKIINRTRLDYTTPGLDNKREIALVVPTIESWNESDEIHFGDAGGGRAVAWIRFGETTDSEGKRVLVIDEIQSKRHQEGREKGYADSRILKIEERNRLQKELADIVENSNPELKAVGDALNEMQERLNALRQEEATKGDNERVEIERLRLQQNEVRRVEEYDELENEINAIQQSIDNRREEIKRVVSDVAEYNYRYDSLFRDTQRKLGKGIPAAPFEKNWHELAMKRMLRYAAENGFDKVAWTTGEQQADRYDIRKTVGSVQVQKFSDGYDVTAYTPDGHKIANGLYGDVNAVAEVYGKELAQKFVESADANKSPNAVTISGDGLKVSGEGMKGFYDRMLPSFVQKYTKKWGAKVGEVTMPTLGQNNTMWSVEVTPQMAEEVMKGQPMFLRTSDGSIYGWAVNGKIFLTPEGMNPNTPAHEYTHLWASMVEKNDPKLWSRIVEVMKESPTWNEVLLDEAYRDIHNNDSRMASEVLSRLSGEENYRRAMELAEREIKAADGIIEKAKKIALWGRIKQALADFWASVKGVFGFKDKAPWMEFVNMSLGDLYAGVNPNAVGSPLERMFIGERGAANLDMAEEVSLRLDNLNVAREMEEAGKDAKAIKIATGWERGADGKWRYEVMDGFVFDKEGNIDFGKRKPRELGDYKRYKELLRKKNALAFEGKELPVEENEEFSNLSKIWRNTRPHNSERLKDFIDAPELFDAYPALRDIVVKFEREGEENGSYSRTSNTITVNPKLSNEQMVSVLVHEIQHAVQHYEGFARGGNTDSVKTKKSALKSDVAPLYEMMLETPEWAEKQRLQKRWFDETDDAKIAEIEARVEEIDNSGVLEGIEALQAELQKKYGLDRTVGRIISSPYAEDAEIWNELPESFNDRFEAYRSLAGEVEARNVQGRMGMTQEERRNSLAVETEDVAREDQIFIEENLGVSKMGSRVKKRMNEIAEYYDDADLSDVHRAIVNVFGGLDNNLPIIINRAGGESRRVIMRQGREDRGGSKHSLLRHFGTSSGNYTAEELLLIEDVLANGELTENERRGTIVNEYQRTINGIRYTVVTEKNDNREEFTDFYTNRSGDTRSFNTQLSARAGHTTASADKDTKNISNTQEENANFRPGEGAYTDEEVAFENDPVSKVLGKPRGTKAQRREFAERERKRMREAVDDVASALNTPIEVLESTEGLTGRRATAKGWYEKSTGRIVVVLPNNKSVADVMQTVLHEAVAHYGLIYVIALQMLTLNTSALQMRMGRAYTLGGFVRKDGTKHRKHPNIVAYHIL